MLLIERHPIRTSREHQDIELEEPPAGHAH
jgi:hypothetical protein